jgi:DNA-binding NtrC family response regulator
MKRLRVLYVDDNKALRQVGNDALKRSGYLTVSTGIDSAALALKHQKFDLILVSSLVEDPTLQRILEAAETGSVLAVVDAPTDEKMLNLVGERLRLYKGHFPNGPF